MTGAINLLILTKLVDQRNTNYQAIIVSSTSGMALFGLLNNYIDRVRFRFMILRNDLPHEILKLKMSY